MTAEQTETDKEYGEHLQFDTAAVEIETIPCKEDNVVDILSGCG